MKRADARRLFFTLWRVTARASIFILVLSALQFGAKCILLSDCIAGGDVIQKQIEVLALFSLLSLLYAKAREAWIENDTIIPVLLLYAGTLTLLVNSIKLLLKLLHA